MLLRHYQAVSLPNPPARKAKQEGQPAWVLSRTIRVDGSPKGNRNCNVIITICKVFITLRVH